MTELLNLPQYESNAYAKKKNQEFQRCKELGIPFVGVSQINRPLPPEYQDKTFMVEFDFVSTQNTLKQTAFSLMIADIQRAYKGVLLDDCIMSPDYGRVRSAKEDTLPLLNYIKTFISQPKNQKSILE